MPNYLAPLRQVRRLVIAAALTCAAVTAIGLWHTSATRKDDKADAKRKFHARVRDGVGRSVKLTRPGDSPGQIRAAVNSVANFLDKRSGVRLSAATLDRLAAMEGAVQGGAARRLTTTELAGAVNAAVLERLSQLNDQEIAYVDDVLRGFKSDDLPAGFGRDFKLPGGVVFMGTPSEKTVARIKAVRDQLNSPAGEVFAGLARQQVKERVEGRARYLSESVPEQFGGMWDVLNDRESSSADAGISPLQAVLIAYSLASDDYFSDGEAALSKRMDSIQKYLTKALGKPYPSPAKHRPYGVNGYLFSSPLDVVFDERTVNRLLDRVAERSAS